MKVNTLHYLYTKKGEKFENNVGMTIFLQKYLVDCFLICIFATSNVCLTIRAESREGARLYRHYSILKSYSQLSSSFIFI